MLKASIEEFYSAVFFKNQALLAIDYGSKKTGIAISDPKMNVAMPFLLIENSHIINQISQIKKIILQKKICGIIIGLPINMDSSISEYSKYIYSFANELANNVSLPIFLKDERMTSRSADNLLKISGLKRKERNKKEDTIAAAIILENVLESFKLIHARHN